MDTRQFFLDIVSAQKAGRPAGVTSVCSAHPVVLEAAMREAARGSRPLLIESTMNQVNQLGGYTGMTPRDFRAFVESLAAAATFPSDRIILGGDHLGPYPWRSEPADQAMRLARDLVTACVEAGYAKIHLDASMPLGGDAVNSAGALEPRLVAEREADMAQAAEAAFGANQKTHPSAPQPVYVIGTEVPAPGGIVGTHVGLEVSDPNELQREVSLCEEAFRERGLTDAWRRVIACVAQPGVEFGNTTVQRYDRQNAASLCRAARGLGGLVIEGHSTDYQTGRSLRELVEDGIAILKVGPSLTFAVRECLFALERIEQELLPAGGRWKLSALAETLEAAMMDNPSHWRSYYTGSAEQKRFARKYSLSDRCRYYWVVPAVQKSVALLMDNLKAKDIPLPLISQYLPLQHRRVIEGTCANSPEALVRESVVMVLENYTAAVARG